MGYRIGLTDMLDLGDPEAYKLHLGAMNKDGDHPLDLFVEDPELWKGWNEWRGKKNDWNRPYIFSLIEFYPKKDTWLFGGVFEVLERHQDGYEIREVKEYEMYVGRLLLAFKRYQGLRGRAFLLENHIENLSVDQLLDQPYSGEVFPGYEWLNHDFSVLEPIFQSEKQDWKTALLNVKGVYLITDTSNGKAYIGSAYGTDGIWNRWAAYIGTFHGWNDRLVNLIKKKGKSYARNNFRFSLLEIHGMYVADDVIIGRESYWKEKLMTRDHGYNAN